MKLTKMDKALLQRVRERVLRTDWTKGHYYKDPDLFPQRKKATYCLVGLINVEASLNPSGGATSLIEYRTAENLLRHHKRLDRALKIKEALLQATVDTGIRKRLPSDLETFNDSTRTKREHIVQVIDYALEHY